MKLTLSWLKEHLDTDASLYEIVDRLTYRAHVIETGSESYRLRAGRAASARRSGKAS